MTAQRVRLPLGRPAFGSYLFLAYPLALAAVAGTQSTWCRRRGLHLYDAPGRGLKLFAHPDVTAPAMRQVYGLSVPGVHRRFVDPREIPAAQRLDWLRDQLARRRYPQVDVDMARLDDGDTEPWLHEILLCGCDADRFEWYGYDGTGRLRRGWIDAHLLEQALRVDGPALLRDAKRRGERVPRWLQQDLSERPLWFLYEIAGRPHTDDATPDDLYDLLRELALYRSSARPLFSSRHPLPLGTRWGLRAQHRCAARIRRGERATLCWRLWWEHKRVMARRIEWLATRVDDVRAIPRVETSRHGACPPDTEGIVRSAHSLARRAGALRLAALRSQSTRHADVIAALVDDEARLIDALLDAAGMAQTETAAEPIAPLKAAA